jgi:hypothetical protein
VSILQFFKHPKHIQSAVVPHLQIFDLLQWSRSEKEWKEECRLAIAHYHRWKGLNPKDLGPTLILYSYVRGQLLRRHAEEVVRYYRLIRRNRRALFNHYLKSLPPVRT